MYAYRIDVQESLLVGLFSGPSNTDDDFARYVESLLRGDQESSAGKAQIAVLVVDRDNPPPNAHWRKQIAEATSQLGGEDTLFVLAAESPLIRGALTAINWIRPPKYEVLIVATAEAMLDAVGARRESARASAAAMLDALRSA